MNNVKVEDNGAAFLVVVNGMTVTAHNSLSGAWNHIAWMYKVATQRFTVGAKEVPVEIWIEGMIKAGMLENDCGMTM